MESAAISPHLPYADEVAKLELPIKKDHNFWNPHIESCDKAGISGSQYCRENNLPISQFLYWRSKCRKQHNDFIGVKISKKNGAECLCSLELPGGYKLLIYNTECLRMLPQILGHIK
jgi:hypothetical protein